MLVLTRKSDEELLIDGHIRVRVLSVDQGRVRLGIVAPRSVQVSRSELLERTPAALSPPRGKPAVCSGRPKEVEHASLVTV